MQTYDPRIYAVGECVQHRGTDLRAGGAAVRAGQGLREPSRRASASRRYDGSVTSTKLKVTGIDLFSAGDFSGGDGHRGDRAAGRRRAACTRRWCSRTTASRARCMYGDTMDGAWYFQLMRDGTDVASLRDKLLFGQAHLGDAGHGDVKNRVAAMADTRRDLRLQRRVQGRRSSRPSRDKKLFTLDEVRAHTKASSSCGSCTGLVEAAAGVDRSAATTRPTPKKKPLCAVHRPHPRRGAHGDPRPVAQDHAGGVSRHLEWKTPDGCNKCRPALNFYLLVAWPGEYAGRQPVALHQRARARQHPEGRHLFGGAAHLGRRDHARRAARASPRSPRSTKCRPCTSPAASASTSSACRRKTLPAMWGDLSEAGFVSGHAYGKAIRTVKTCVGKTWCRFGTQDSTTMGIQLEKMTWGSWTPHKFKLARVRLPAQLRRGHASRTSAWCASIPATSCTSAATAA
ncbi:MAG: hypothetical protein MZW92_27245 [Comamonadaceae bacterium]|nr:hypothetical protein [Comamonadaceae bacterium]